MKLTEGDHRFKLGRRSALIASIAAPVALIGGCASSPVDATAGMEPGAGLAFGAFDFRESDIGATHVVLMRISPTKLYMGGSGERGTVTFTNGEFYALNLSPGRYVVNGFYSRDVYVAFEGNLESNTFVVEPGRPSYAGSYRFSYTRKRWIERIFKSDDASFARVDSRQDEVRLLKWLSQELAKSEWAGPVRARVAAFQGG